jgi:hypothetical protein
MLSGRSIQSHEEEATNGLPPSSALILVFRGKSARDELISTVAIDTHTFASTPTGKTVRIDIDTLDDVSLSTDFPFPISQHF